MFGLHMFARLCEILRFRSEEETSLLKRSFWKASVVAMVHQCQNKSSKVHKIPIGFHRSPMVSGGSTRVDAGYAGPELGVDVDHQFQDPGAIDLGDFQIVLVLSTYSWIVHWWFQNVSNMFMFHHDMMIPRIHGSYFSGGWKPPIPMCCIVFALKFPLNTTGISHTRSDSFFPVLDNGHMYKKQLDLPWFTTQHNTFHGFSLEPMMFGDAVLQFRGMALIASTLPSWTQLGKHGLTIERSVENLGLACIVSLVLPSGYD